MFTIGEFSKITGLTIKALRLYHEKGILEPHLVDEQSGYRYYNHQDAEKARVVRLLKGMMLGLDEIAEILRGLQQRCGRGGTSRTSSEQIWKAGSTTSKKQGVPSIPLSLPKGRQSP